MNVASQPTRQKVSAKKQIIKVLVADDHPVVRKGLQTCLARQGHLKVVGEAADGDEALRKARELSPDVVLMDISMPGMNGLAVTEVLRKEAPEMKVLILSVHSNKDYIFRVIQAGAHGYVSKEAPPEELVRAIESVYDGRTSLQRGYRPRRAERIREQRREEGALFPAHQPRTRGPGPDRRRPEQQGNCRPARHRRPHHRNAPGTHHAPAQYSLGGRA